MWRPSRAELAAAVVALAVLAAWANAITASFQFDDWNVIVADPRVQSPAAWWQSMPGIRPLLKLSYALNHAWLPGAAGFHAVNVGIHLANVLLVLALLARWPGRAVSAPAGVAAIVAALVFALHPVQTEAVTYASGRSTSLAALCVLASLVSWIAGRERGSMVLASVASPLLFALALGVRETAAVLPFALLLWRATAGAAPGDRASGLRATAVHWAVLALGMAAALALPAYRAFFATSLEARGFVAQVLTQVNAVGYLVGQLVRPDRLNADPMLPVLVAPTAWLILQGLVLAALVAAGLLQLRRRPAIAFGVLWFFLWLAPTNSFLPRLDVANDRQLYLALLGPAWLVGLVVARWTNERRRVAIGIAAALALGLGLATAARNGIYADEIRFWTDVTAKTPANSRAWSNLGYAYALSHRDADAARAFRRALALDPANARAAANLRLLQEGRLVEDRPR